MSNTSFEPLIFTFFLIFNEIDRIYEINFKDDREIDF